MDVCAGTFAHKCVLNHMNATLLICNGIIAHDHVHQKNAAVRFFATQVWSNALSLKNKRYEVFTRYSRILNWQQLLEHGLSEIEIACTITIMAQKVLIM